MFKKVEPKPIFPQLEEDQLLFWEKEKIFNKSLKQREGAEEFIFYEGPPTANGRPGLHHVLARVYKDIICRYKTMRGFKVVRKAGWDTQGLPVEIEVEKELGLKSKKDVEKYGVAKFNKKCKESVWRYKDDWERLTRRIAYWIDLEHPYITYENEYLETLWWIVKQIDNKGLLYKDYKVVPYCPRCGSALSSHEVAQGYKDTKDPSIFIKFPIPNSQFPNTYLLVWTTTPWTLPGNVALAFSPKISYVLIKVGKENFILAEERLKVISEPYKVIKKLSLQDLEGLQYQPLYTFLKPDKKAYFLVSADIVNLEEGTGLVHMAPAFGEEDMEVAREKNLPYLLTVDTEGKFIPAVKPWAKKFVKDADAEIIADLKKRALLYREEKIVHTYPFCWRCDSPLLYYAEDSWFIRMSALRARLLSANKTINWIPKHLREGRFGMWLKEVKDWAVSRERFWGTPMPVWVCSCGKREVIGSIKELKEKATKKLSEVFDLHKPFIDEVRLTCACGEEMKRTPEVMDAWFDSGAMPFAQYHYPFENSKINLKKKIPYPADYIAEGIDQTRGWFYTLLAIAVLLGKESPYKNVISLGHVLDKFGKKMSKSRGNVVDPWMLAGKYGMDAVRWYFFTVNAPGEPKNFDEKDVEKIIRGIMLKIWHVYSFFVTYANIDKPPLANSIKQIANGKLQNVLDQWISSLLNALILEVGDKLEDYDIVGAARAIEGFVDDLSNWYVRRSRRRFWKSENDADKNQAYAVLYEVLIVLTQLLAPFTPFITEEIYKNLSGKESVHLTDWPRAKKTLVDKDLNAEMAAARRIAALGLALRKSNKIKVRQPLSLVYIQSKIKFSQNIAEILQDELNVKKVKMVSSLPPHLPRMEDKELAAALDIKITKELREEGWARELVRHLQEMRKKSGFHVADRIVIYYQTESSALKEMLTNWRAYISKETLARELLEEKKKGDRGEEAKINKEKIWLAVKKIKP